MAKFSRFDPRNKKINNHKTQSLNKDIKIRELNGKSDNKMNLLKEVVYDQLDDVTAENNQLLS